MTFWPFDDQFLWPQGAAGIDDFPIWVQLIPRSSNTFIIFLHDCRNVLRLYLDELGGEMIIIMIIDHKLCYHLDHRDDNDDQCYHDHDDQWWPWSWWSSWWSTLTMIMMTIQGDLQRDLQPGGRWSDQPIFTQVNDNLTMHCNDDDLHSGVMMIMLLMMMMIIIIIIITMWQ